MYLIEVKDKFESPETSEARNECMSRGEMFEHRGRISRDNRICAILRHAQKQLEETPGDSSAYRIIWFHSNGFDADLKYRQIFATFYGHVHLIAVEPRSAGSITCFYFDYSAAFESPSIDALILSDDQSIQLCLNEFSSRFDSFRTSFLWKRFDERGAVFDPRARRESGEIIAFMSNLPRKNDLDVCKALQNETGILYTALRPYQYTWSTAVQTTKDTREVE